MSNLPVPVVFYENFCKLDCTLFSLFIGQVKFETTVLLCIHLLERCNLLFEVYKNHCHFTFYARQSSSRHSSAVTVNEWLLWLIRESEAIYLYPWVDNRPRTVYRQHPPFLRCRCLWSTPLETAFLLACDLAEKLNRGGIVDVTSEWFYKYVHKYTLFINLSPNSNHAVVVYLRSTKLLFLNLESFERPVCVNHNNIFSFFSL